MNKHRKRKKWVTNTPQKQKFTAVSSCSDLVTAASQAELQSTPMRAEMRVLSVDAAENQRVDAIIEENCAAAQRYSGLLMHLHRCSRGEGFPSEIRAPSETQILICSL